MEINDDQQTNALLKLLNGVAAMQSEGLFTDVTLTSRDGLCIPAHRIILTAASSYFKLMFTIKMTENKTRSVHMRNVDGPILREIISFIYSARAEISLDNVTDLLAAAHMVELSTLVNMCEHFMMNNINMTTVIGYFQVARLYDLERMRSEASRYILVRFEIVSSAKCFLDLASADVVELLSSELLTTKSENTVFLAAIRWINSRLEEDETLDDPIFSDIISCVHFDQLKRQFIKDVMKMQSMAMQYSFTEIMNQLEPVKVTRVRRGLMQKRLVTISPDGNCLYRDNIDTWRLLTLLNFDCIDAGHASVSSDSTTDDIRSPTGGNAVDMTEAMVGAYDFGFVFIGFCQTRTKALLYNNIDDELIRLPDMPHVQRCGEVLCIDADIFVFGGMDIYNKVVDTVQCFDMVSSTWQLKQPLPQPNMMPIVTQYNDSAIYLFGGYSGLVPVASVWVYYFRQDSWMRCHDMPILCNNAVGGAVVISSDEICLVTRKRILTYYPMAEHWDIHTLTQSLQPAISHPIVHNNKMAILSGHRDSTVFYLNYNRHTKEWVKQESHKDCEDLPLDWCRTKWSFSGTDLLRPLMVINFLSEEHI